VLAQVEKALEEADDSGDTRAALVDLILSDSEPGEDEGGPGRHTKLLLRARDDHPVAAADSDAGRGQTARETGSEPVAVAVGEVSVQVVLDPLLRTGWALASETELGVVNDAGGRATEYVLSYLQ